MAEQVVAVKEVVRDVLEVCSRPAIDLEGTLGCDLLCEEFRVFIRKQLDKNRSPDPKQKQKMEVWLDLVLHCQKIFSLPESEVEERIRLMVEVGTVYLAKRPEGHNIALPGAQGRSDLVAHCEALRLGTLFSPDLVLLRNAAFNWVWSKLEQKHDLWRKLRNPPTRLQALCMLL